MHDHDPGSSRLRATCKQVGLRILGVLLLLVLGGCATRPPLPGLLPGMRRPDSLRTPMASTTVDTSARSTPVAARP